MPILEMDDLIVGREYDCALTSHERLPDKVRLLEKRVPFRTMMESGVRVLILESHSDYEVGQIGTVLFSCLREKSHEQEK